MFAIAVAVLVAVVLVVVAVRPAAASCTSAVASCGDISGQPCIEACNAVVGCCHYLNAYGPRRAANNGVPTCDVCGELDPDDKAKLTGVFTAWGVDPGVVAQLVGVSCPRSGAQRIDCDDYGEVTEVQMSAFALKGDIGWICDIFIDMPRLTHFNVDYNDLYGSVPDCITFPAALEQFNVMYNNLRGPLPRLFQRDGMVPQLSPTGCQLVSNNLAPFTDTIKSRVYDERNCFTCPEGVDETFNPPACHTGLAPDVANKCNYLTGQMVTECTPTDPAGTTTLRSVITPPPTHQGTAAPTFPLLPPNSPGVLPPGAPVGFPPAAAPTGNNVPSGAPTGSTAPTGNNVPSGAPTGSTAPGGAPTGTAPSDNTMGGTPPAAVVSVATTGAVVTVFSACAALVLMLV